MTKLFKYEIHKTAIGGQSLIGTGKERPVSWGNYFWLASGPRVLNFWSENLQSADEKFNLGGKVRIRRYKSEKSDVCIIDDIRIPSNWYYNKLCFTGGGSVSVEVAKDIYEYLGDPTGELEQFTDPVSYYEKRGGKYNPATGWISYAIEAPSRKLDTSWTIEALQDIEIDTTFDIEEEMANALKAEICNDVSIKDDIEKALISDLTIKQLPPESGYFIAPYIPRFKCSAIGLISPTNKDDERNAAIKLSQSHFDKLYNEEIDKALGMDVELEISKAFFEAFYKGKNNE